MRFKVLSKIAVIMSLLGLFIFWAITEKIDSKEVYIFLMSTFAVAFIAVSFAKNINQAFTKTITRKRNKYNVEIRFDKPDVLSLDESRFSIIEINKAMTERRAFVAGERDGTNKVSTRCVFDFEDRIILNSTKTDNSFHYFIRYTVDEKDLEKTLNPAILKYKGKKYNSKVILNE